MKIVLQSACTIRYLYMSVSLPTTDYEQLVRRLAACEAELQHTQAQLAREREERHQVEQILHETDQTLIKLIEHVPVAVVGIDTDYMVTTWNSAAEQLFGWMAEEVIGKPSPFHASKQPLVPTDTATAPTSRTELVTRQRRDGSVIDLVSTTFTLYNTRSQASGWMLLMADMTEWRHAEAELNHAYYSLEATTLQLQRSRNLLQTLFDGLNNGFLLLDGAGSVLAINKALATMFGLQSEEVIGSHWSNLTRTTGFDVLGMVILQSLYDSRPRRRRETCTLYDDRRVVIDLQTLVLAGANNSVENIILHVTDITEQLQSETVELQNERFAASAQLLATIAHELNTPLLSIQSCLFLAEQAGGPNRDAYLKLAHEEIDRITQVLRQLLDLHRPDTMDRVDVALNPLIERVLLLTGGMLAEHHIHVERELDPLNPTVMGFPGQLTQVLINLIFNATQAMPCGGKLILRSKIVPTWPSHAYPDYVQHSDESVALLEVVDTGIGIDPERIAEIFKPFYTTRAMGTGLGLAICKQIMQRHQGAIGVMSVLNVGSTFTLAFPQHL
jgi:PAS domain S-box-containing protein